MCNSALVSWIVRLFLCFTVLLRACAQGNTFSRFSVSNETKGRLNLYTMHELYSIKMEVYPVYPYGRCKRNSALESDTVSTLPNLLTEL
jgi:hypothetical protein